MNSFKLTEHFVNKYKDLIPPFGFGGLSYAVYYRTYSRVKEDGINEEWYVTVKRVVEGTYNMQKRWIEHHGLEWNGNKAQLSAQEMYHRIYWMKFLPPGRGLWAMGSSIIEEKGLHASLNNCAFVSTENIKEDLSKPFAFLMDMSMLGVGVGFDVKGENTLNIKSPDIKREIYKFAIPDSREGWVESLILLLESYFNGTSPIEFDYSIIRKKGEPIKTFGGTASGPEPLIEMHQVINKILKENSGYPIKLRTIVDLMNLIGKCVVSGNVRRSSEIALGDYKSKEFLNLKNYNLNPDRKSYGWSSNNTIFADLGMDYSECSQITADNGEPGYLWLDNIRDYSRLSDIKDYKDKRVMGVNPCAEQSLEPYELCCLVETFPYRNKDLEDFKRTLKFAYLYAKTVTLGKTHWPETNRVLLRNRRIGCSMSGIAQFISHNSTHLLKQLCEEGYKSIQYYDEIYSDWLAIPKSKKTTSIKPSGTISLLTGSTPGVHYPESRFCIRRMRIADNSNLLEPLKLAGYKIEKAENELQTVVVEFPIDYGENIRSKKDISIWEQVELASFLQKYWADNQVSCTVSFKKEEANQIKHVLDLYQYQLKSISFLPFDTDKYTQMPIEPITEKKYKELIKNIQPIKFIKIKGEKADVEKGCDGATCALNFNNKDIK